MTSRELAVRSDDAFGLSPALREAGVEIATTEDGRYRAVTFPASLRESMNLLLPTEEIVQADPNYTPTIRAVRLDPNPDGPHFYKQQGKLAPRKQALEILADTAGIRLARARPMRRAELTAYPEGTIGYEATVVLRRSDGTPKEITAHKIWDPTVERYRIEGEVAEAARKNQWSEQRARDEVRKRLLFEKTHGSSKTESKAILRAIRSALQIPHTYSSADAAKPFVVVGYSFTPDYDDPEVRRLLVEQGYASSASVYGRAELDAASVETGEVDAATSPAERDAPPGRGAAASSSEGASSERPPDAPSPFSGAEPEPPGDARPGDEEPRDSGAVSGTSVPADPGAFVLDEQFTRYAGRTLREVDDAEYLAWLASEAVEEPTRAAARAYLTAESRS